jgi:hypothetical protein
VSEPDVELHYALRLLPAGRFPFRRYRFELWHGPRLLATGWRTSEAHARHALRERATTVARVVVARAQGVHVLRPDYRLVPLGEAA